MPLTTYLSSFYPKLLSPKVALASPFLVSIGSQLFCCRFGVDNAILPDRTKRGERVATSVMYLLSER